MSRLISELPHSIKITARNYKISNHIEDDVDSLAEAFIWNKTKEGHDIWSEINKSNYQPFYDFHSTKQKLTPKEWCKNKGYNEYHVMIIEQYLNDTQ